MWRTAFAARARVVPSRRLAAAMIVVILALAWSVITAPHSAAASTVGPHPSDIASAATTIVASASATTTTHGQGVVIRYTVTSGGEPLRGAATEIQYAGRITPVTLDEAGRGAISMRDLPVGAPAVIIRFRGDAGLAPASTTLYFSVSPRPTAIAGLTTSAATVSSGQPVVVRYTVTGQSGKPLARVRTAITYRGTTVWARAGSDGRVAVNLTNLSVGRLPVLVRYFGDAANAAASATTMLTVTSSCPATADACIDLAHDLTWLQEDGEVSYGPVPITSGRAGYHTRTGMFRVYWKNKYHMSSIYRAPMPNSIFFDGGIAFHEGSLAVPSHGCIHLSRAASEVYWNKLSTGDTVYAWGTAPY